MKTIKTLLAATTILMASASQSGAVTDFDRFQLWNGCAKISLVVESVSDDARGIGLTKEDIETAIRSKLRPARLYSDNESEINGHLYARISVLGNAFDIDVEFRKIVHDVNSGELNYGATWNTGTIGTSGGSSAFILSSLSADVDEFIDEFYRVNEEACG